MLSGIAKDRAEPLMPSRRVLMAVLVFALAVALVIFFFAPSVFKTSSTETSVPTQTPTQSPQSQVYILMVNVLDRNGTPISDMKVEIYRNIKTCCGMVSTLVINGTTNKNGMISFNLFDKKAGYTIKVLNSQGTLLNTTNFTLNSDKEIVTIRL